MAHIISINNGNTACEIADALETVGMDVIVNSMDDEIREMVHGEIAPCTDEEFIEKYLEYADIIIG